jgi:hypothetical protein
MISKSVLEENVMSDAMKTLLASRKFWLVILDAGTSTLAVVLALFLKPESVDKILALVALWQPVMLLLINSITVQNVEGIKAEGKLAEANAYKYTPITADTLPENKPTPEGASPAELKQK